MPTEETVPEQILQIEAEARTPEPDVQTVLPVNATRKVESAVDIDSIRRELSVQSALNARLELDHLRKLLSAQEAAKLHAQSTASQLQRQLRSVESEGGMARSALKRAQDQLALVKEEQTLEADKSAGRESALRKELAHVREQATHALEKASGYRKKSLVISSCVAIPAVILAVVGFLHQPGTAGTNDERAADPVVAEAATPHRLAPSGPASQQASKSGSKPTSGDFAGGLGRLDQALENFKSEKPEDVLRRVRIQNAARGISVCAFEWHDGDASLEFGAKAGVNLDLAMSNCAEAVEKSAQ
jgi:hypothetical protein